MLVAYQSVSIPTLTKQLIGGKTLGDGLVPIRAISLQLPPVVNLSKVLLDALGRLSSTWLEHTSLENKLVEDSGSMLFGTVL